MIPLPNVSLKHSASTIGGGRSGVPRPRSAARRAIRHDILDFFVRTSVTITSETPIERCRSVSAQPVLVVVVSAAIIQSGLPQLEFGEDTIIGSEI